MGAGASRATGERAVSVGGDVVGSLIVTGDNNNIKLVLGAEQGALLEQLTRASAPKKRLRPGPLRSVPGELQGRVDREDEARAILESIAGGAPVGVHGERGIGKTYTILRALNAQDPALADGAVYLYAPGPLDDVRQLLFEAWYECEPPFKPSTVQLRRELAAIRGVAALDSVELERDAAQQLLLDAPGARLVISSRERIVLEGASIAIHGLASRDALIVLEQELGRPLAADERPDAERICVTLAGHPLKIREAVASARDAGRSLSDLAGELSAGHADAAVARDKLEASGEEGRRLLAALALFEDATVGKEHLRAIAGAENFDEALLAALRRRDVRAHSPRYDLGAVLGSYADELDLAPAGERALVYFTSWAQRNREDAALLMTEAAALLALLRWAESSGRRREAIELGRAIDHAFALERRFGAWGQVLEVVHRAAVRTGDRDAEAWALHQLGTRALCLGELAAGVATLSNALELRRELGDEDGASYSARNLSMASRPRWYTRWIVGHTMLFVGLLIALFAAGVVAAATIPGGGSSTTPTTKSGVQGSSSSTTQSNSGHHTTTTTTGSTSTTPRTINSLTISLTGDGQGQVKVDPGGKVCQSDCKLSFEQNTPLTLTAEASGTSMFAGFTNCSTSATPCSLTLSSDATVGAEFEPPATLSVKPAHVNVTSDPTGIACPGACTFNFPLHKLVTLHSNVAAVWTATGCAQRPLSATTCSIKLDSPVNSVAVFWVPPPPPPPPTSSTSTSPTTTPTTLTGPA
jgi:hypothetical protein